MKKVNASIYIGVCNYNYLAQQLFDTPFPILEESVLWVAPKLKQGQGWKFVTQFFTLTNWLLSISVLLITAFAFRYFATKAKDSDRKYKKFSECLLFIYSCFFNMGNNILPKDGKLRLICLSLGPFALNISAYLQGRLFGALTHPIYTERVGSIEELSTTMPLVIQEHMLILFLSSKSNKTYNFIKSGRQSMRDDLEDVVKFQNIATVVNEQLLHDQIHFTPYIQTQTIMKYQIALYVMKHDMLYKIINDMIKKMVEHGIVKRLVSDMQYNFKLRCLRYLNCWDGNIQISSLSAVDLRGAFFVLNFGFVVGALIFLFEIFYHYFNYYKIRNIFLRK